MSQEDKSVAQKKTENAEAVADLEISSEKAEEIQGGGFGLLPYGGFQGGVRVASGDVN